jgi:hypothetical protein
VLIVIDFAVINYFADAERFFKFRASGPAMESIGLIASPSRSVRGLVSSPRRRATLRDPRDAALMSIKNR